MLQEWRLFLRDRAAVKTQNENHLERFHFNLAHIRRL